MANWLNLMSIFQHTSAIVEVNVTDCCSLSSVQYNQPMKVILFHLSV